MATDRDIQSMLRLHVTFAELKAALLEADINERRLETDMVPWPTDIGFVIGPANEWLLQVLTDTDGLGDTDVPDPELRVRIAALARDQQRLLAGWRPSTIALASAPIISPDTVFVTPGLSVHVINLVGHVRNVPGGGSDRRRITSAVAVFDADRFAWVRTMSRFYRLDRGQAGSRLSGWPTDGEASSGNNSVDGDER